MLSEVFEALAEIPAFVLALIFLILEGAFSSAIIEALRPILSSSGAEAFYWIIVAITALAFIADIFKLTKTHFRG